MSTVVSPALPRTAPQPGVRVSFPRVLRSEWLKLFTLRSTYWTLGIAFLTFVGMAVIIAVSVVAAPQMYEGVADGSADIVATVASAGLLPATIAFAVLAALAVTSEYSTGSIRSTAAAVPTRLPFLVAKLLVVVAVTFAVGALAEAVAFGIGGLISPSVLPDLQAPEVTRILVGVPLFLAAFAAFTAATGALLRSTAATIAVVMALLLAVENAISFIPWEPLKYVRPLLPSSSGQALVSTQESLDAMAQMSPRAFDAGPWGGYAILVAWVVVLGVAAAVRLRARDV